MEIRSTKLFLRLPPRDADTLPRFSIPRNADRQIGAGMDLVEMDHVVVLPACAADSLCLDSGGIDTLLFWRIGKAPGDGTHSYPRYIGYRVDGSVLSCNLPPCVIASVVWFCLDG